MKLSCVDGILFALISIIMMICCEAQLGLLVNDPKTGVNVLKIEDAEKLAAVKNMPKVMDRMFQFMKSTKYIKAVGKSALNLMFLMQDRSNQLNIDGERFLTLFKQQLKQNDGILLPKCFTKKINSDSKLPMPPRVTCCPLPEIKCDESRTYRTIDGSCNCLKNADMGRSNRAFRRLLPPDYADGLNEPRVALDGKPLPNARLISFKLFDDKPNIFSPILTQFHFSVGQVVDHDFDRTAVSMMLNEDGEMVGVACGKENEERCRTSELEDIQCFPISIPDNDPFFKGKRSCLPFVRAQIFFADKCRISERQQVNALTGWLDSSFMYGSNKADLDFLRDQDPKRGKMKTSKHPKYPECGPLLPTIDDTEECKKFGDFKRCFKAGDARTNEQVGLTAMHTVFVRLHNFFEEGLFKRHKRDWTGEQLFQETKKLVNAVWQNIVYGEYLPLLLGSGIMKAKKLYIQKKGCFKGYDCTNYNSDVPNVFATAAFRYGHSQLGTILKMSNAEYTQRSGSNFSQVMFNPTLIYEKQFSDSTCGVNALLHGLSDQSSDRVDEFFTQEVTRRLFTESPQTANGTDLVALNIQRGRDHGIPGYIHWRKYCNLTKPTSFNTMKDISKAGQDKLQDLYNNVQDVDLFPAGILEKPVKGGIIGPTFACVIGSHFQNVKFADRYWFERCNIKGGLTTKQIQNVRKYTSGRMYCDTLKLMENIQKFPMMVSLKQAETALGKNAKAVKKLFPLFKKTNNERVPCSQLPGINFKLW